jgi:leucyl/phenylalanyl-tRNA--protein transferase
MAPAPEPFDPPLTPELIVAAYQQGAFPMADSRAADSLGWYIPEQRAIVPLDDLFNCPRSVRRHLRLGTFELRLDTAFDQVIHACAAPRAGEDETWINQRIVDAYISLHRMGIAHCVEAWRDGQLVGGLYGLAMGGAFFGESMFHDAPSGGTDASKVCLVHLVEHLRHRHFTLLDAQLPNPHLDQFNATIIDHDAFMHRLHAALQLDVTW